MTEKEARNMARRHPNATRAGWLLACDSPDNVAKGQRIIDGMGFEDSNIAIAYRDFCLNLYNAARKTESI